MILYLATGGLAIRSQAPCQGELEGQQDQNQGTVNHCTINSILDKIFGQVEASFDGYGIAVLPWGGLRTLAGEWFLSHKNGAGKDTVGDACRHFRRRPWIEDNALNEKRGWTGEAVRSAEEDFWSTGRGMGGKA